MELDKLRKEAGAIEKTALDWNPQGYRRTGRPKRTWRRTTEDETRNTGRSWNEVKGIAGDRNAGKSSCMPYAPQGVKGTDDDDDDDEYCYFTFCFVRVRNLLSDMNGDQRLGRGISGHRGR
jgi:hypothetical protein